MFYCYFNITYFFVDKLCKCICGSDKTIKNTKSKSKKNLYIIRGVPGIGKLNYIYQLNKNNNNLFTIISNNNYFL